MSAPTADPGRSGETDVLLIAEQLRRRVPGGSGTYVTGLLRGLRDMGDHGLGTPPVTLFASRGTGAARRRDPLASYGLPLVTSRLVGPALTRMWDRGWVRAPSGFSVIHGASLAVPQSRDRGGTRTIVTLHDLAWRHVPFAYPRHGREWHEAKFREALDAGREFVVPSEVVAGEVISAGAGEGRVRVIEPGGDHLPDPDRSVAEGLLAELEVSGPFVVSVGTLEPRKNLQALSDAFAKLRASLGTQWSMVVVGPPGWGPGVAERDGVVLAGAVSPVELSSLIAGASLLAYVPLMEGFGLPPLEAMQVGTPVVASKVPSVGDAALVVDPRNVDDIAAGLIEVASDQETRERLVSAGHERASKLTWKACAIRHVELWRGSA